MLNSDRGLNVRKLLSDMLAIYIIACALIVTVVLIVGAFRVATDTGCVSGTVYGTKFAWGNCAEDKNEIKK